MNWSAKSWKVAGSLIGLMIIGGAFNHYQKRTITVKKTVTATKGDVILKNIENSNLKIETGDVDEISVRLTGAADQLKEIHFNQESATLTEIGLPEELNNVKGTIVIPNHLRIIDLNSKPFQTFDPKENNKNKASKNRANKNISPSSGGGNNASSSQKKADQPQGTTSQSNSNSSSHTSSAPNGTSNSTHSTSSTTSTSSNPTSNRTQNVYQALCGNGIIDSLNGENCDDGNTQSGDGCSDTCKAETIQPECGNGIREIGEECDDGNQENNDSCDNLCKLDIYTKWAGERCSIDLKQSERNECCQATMVNEPHRSCDGQWEFDYFSRLCVWHCPDEQCYKRDGANSQKQCCNEQNASKPTPTCLGEWDLNQDSQICEFNCSQPIVKTERRPPSEISTTSQYCVNTYTEKQDQSQCCDQFLKHPLSIGPREGFPDCIGRWQVPAGSNQCKFSCVSHEEMIEILKKIKSEN